MYNIYLNNYNADLNIPDPFTMEVADESSYFLNILGFNSHVIINPKIDLWPMITIDNVIQCIINEGCNAISIMIIFVSFIIAFSTTWLQTLLFTLIGLLMVHISNIARIAWFNYICAYYPKYIRSVHDYIFPSIIYGTILILWIIWMAFFVFKNPSNEKH